MKPGPARTPLRLPAWADGMPDSTMVTLKELAPAMGIKAKTIASRLPAPDWLDHKPRPLSATKPTHRWHLGTIRALIRAEGERA